MKWKTHDPTQWSWSRSLNIFAVYRDARRLDWLSRNCGMEYFADTTFPPSYTGWSDHWHISMSNEEARRKIEKMYTEDSLRFIIDERMKSDGDWRIDRTRMRPLCCKINPENHS